MPSSHSIYWDFLALSAGVLFTLAFAPFDYGGLAVMGLGLLFACWQNINPGRAALRGYWFGLGSFGLGVSWVYISIHDFGKADMASSSLLTSLFVGFWALFPALAGWLYTKMAPKQGGMLFLPLIWTLTEYLRGVIVLNGFPWLLSAYAQMESPLAGYIPIIGAYGTSFLVALTAAVLAFIAVGKGSPARKPVLLIAIAMLWLTGGCYGQSHGLRPQATLSKPHWYKATLAKTKNGGLKTV